MEKVNRVLKRIGLSETETKVYLTGLSYYSIGVNELQKQTNINRTTIYHALETLTQKGLAAKKGTSGRVQFTMTKPENIKHLIEKEIISLKQKKEELDEVIPILMQRLLQDESKIRVSHFEGIDGMKLVIEEALYCKSRNWEIIAPENNFFSEFDALFAKYFINARKARSITSRSLWEFNPDRRKLTTEEIKFRNPRYLPASMYGKFKSVIILFDDKVAIISSLKEVSAILIQSIEIHATMLALFEGLWENSKNYNELT